MKLTRLLAAWLLVTWGVAMAEAGPVAIAIHGGAGTINRADMTADTERAYREALTRAVRAGHEVLLGHQVHHALADQTAQSAGQLVPPPRQIVGPQLIDREVDHEADV